MSEGPNLSGNLLGWTATVSQHVLRYSLVSVPVRADRAYWAFAAFRESEVVI